MDEPPPAVERPEELVARRAGLRVRARDRPARRLRLWSAGRSAGQEATSLAMFLDDQVPRISPVVPPAASEPSATDTGPMADR